VESGSLTFSTRRERKTTEFVRERLRRKRKGEQKGRSYSVPFLTKERREGYQFRLSGRKEEKRGTLARYFDSRKTGEGKKGEKAYPIR